MAAEVPRHRRWSSIFSPSSFQKQQDVNTRISLPFLDFTDPVELRCASVSSDLSQHHLNKENSESTIVQSDATPSTDRTLTVQEDGNITVSQNHHIHVDDITVTPIRHARDKSLASDFKFGGDPSSDVPPIPDLPPRIAPLFSRNTSFFSTRSSVPSLRRPPRFDPRGFCRPDEYLRHWRPSHLPHISTGSSLYSTDTTFWSQLPAFEERYPHLQRPQFPIPRGPWPPIHPLAQSYENIISPMLLNYVAHPTLAAIVDIDSPVSEVAAIETRFSSRDTYLDQSERWESMYHGTSYQSDYAQSDYQSDARSESQSETESALPANDVHPPVPGSPLSSKEHGDEPPESSPRDECAPLRVGIILFSLWFGNLLVSLQDTMVPIALPSISSDLHGLKDVAEYLSWYLLAFTVAYPISHKLYRLFDARVVYLFAVILFAATAQLRCALANFLTIMKNEAPEVDDTVHELQLAPLCLDASCAALLQGSTSIIEFIVPASNDNNSLIDYVKFVESAYAFSLAIGPVLAGVIVDRWDWRWCFWINGITGTCLFILVAVFFRRCSMHEVQCKGSIFAKLRSLDYLGPISSSGALLCLLLALHWAGLEHAWTSVTTLGLLFAFVFLSILLIFVEWIQEDRAMLPPMTLRREVLWSSLFLFCAYGTSAMISLYIPFYFQVGQGTSAMVSGIRNLPLVLPSIAAIILAVGTSFHGRHCISYMLVGQIVTSLGLTFFSTQGESSDAGVWLVLLSIIGFGLGITTLFPYFMLGGIFENKDRLKGHLIMIFFSRLGGTIIPSVAQNIFIKMLQKELGSSLSPTTLVRVIKVGATRLETLALEANDLAFVREAFLIAISRVTYTGLAVTLLGMFFLLALWLILFAALTFYNLRIVERLWGSRKFASFILVILPYTIFLPPLLLALVLRPLSFGNVNYLPAGPTSILFAILAQYHAAIPSTYRYSVGMARPTAGSSTATSNPTTTQSAAAQFTAMRNSTVALTSKTIYYMFAIQLALSQFPSSILPAAVGWTVGYAYRNEVLPATSWRVPSWVVGQKNKRPNVEALRRRLEGEDTADNDQNGVVGTGLAQISEIFNRRTQ
ncbi:hypothetical protein EG327_010386 [Venturia inaequalis]|uniref:Major facilitator superfamily (MFS) profile domain-containing protein n=1 Tax=Venturia inaequalis TaxID=5025 RepID=A0A8H3YR17_VENIN|nr:hypothetical protein EG327_010386 [Venturia inaequalis]